MKKYKRYSAGFKEQALVKVYSRGNDQTIQSVADELNINLTTLKTWMKQSQQDVNKPALPKSKRPKDWSPEERLAALQQSYRLFGEDLNTWCRGGSRSAVSAAKKVPSAPFDKLRTGLGGEVE